MATVTYTHGDWSIAVQTVKTGQKGPWMATASRPTSGIVETSAYSSRDDAYGAILDLIRQHEGFEERWDDFFKTLACGTFDLAMRGEFNLVPVHERLLESGPGPDAYQALRTIALYEPAAALLTPEDLLATILELQAMARALLPDLAPNEGQP